MITGKKTSKQTGKKIFRKSHRWWENIIIISQDQTLNLKKNNNNNNDNTYNKPNGKYQTHTHTAIVYYYVDKWSLYNDRLLLLLLFKVSNLYSCIWMKNGKVFFSPPLLLISTTIDQWSVLLCHTHTQLLLLLKQFRNKWEKQKKMPINNREYKAKQKKQWSHVM